MTNPQDDAARWNKEADDLRHTSLDRVRKTAEAWGASITTALGVFALVAFVKGPDAIKDVPTGAGKGVTLSIAGWAIGPFDAAETAAVTIFAAAVLVIVAVILAALAAQGSPSWNPKFVGTTLQNAVATQSKRAVRELLWSRILTIVALTLVLFGLWVVWWATIDAKQKAPAPTTDAIVGSGTAMVCGVLDTGGDGSLTVTPDGGSAVAVSSGTAVTIVDDCP